MPSPALLQEPSWAHCPLLIFPPNFCCPCHQGHAVECGLRCCVLCDLDSEDVAFLQTRTLSLGFFVFLCVLGIFICLGFLWVFLFLCFAFLSGSWISVK